METRRLYVTGLVQGVFFRVEAQKKAQELGVLGWVRNTEDGGVEIHAEGPKEKIDALEQWCRTGPPKAHVQKVTSTAAAANHYTSFEVWQ